MQAGAVNIKLMADLLDLQQKMAQVPGIVGGAMESVKRSVEQAKAVMQTLAGAVSLYAFTSMIKSSIDAAAAMHDLSIQTGASVEALTGLASIGKFSGISAETIGASMNKLAKNMSGATEESRGAGKAIEALGLNFNSFKALLPDQQMLAVSKALDSFQDGAGKSAVAMALFGKEGAQLLPMFKDLAVAGDLQAKLTKEQGDMADNFSDNLTRLKASGEGWKKELVSGMLPALDTTVQAFVNVMEGSGGVRAEMKKLAADGSIKTWTSQAVTALTYVMDAGSGVMRAFESVGKALGAVLATNAAAYRGNFSEIKTIWTEFGSDFTKLWNDKMPGQKMRDEVAALEAAAAAAKAAGATAEAAKPKLDFTNIFDKNEKAGKAVKAVLDEVAKAITANELAANKWLDQNEKTLDGLIAENQKLREQNEAIGLSKEELAALTLARQDAAIAQAQLTLIEAQNIEGNEARIEQIRREVRLLQERRELTAAGQMATAAADAQKAAIDAAERAAKDAAAEWRRAADQIEQSLSDALMSGFTAGKGFAKSFVDSVKAMFNTMVLKPVISAIVSPVAGALTSAMGFSGTANAASGIGNASSLLGTAGSIGTFASSAGSVAAGIYGGIGELSSLGIGEAVTAGLTGVLEGSFAAGFGTIAGALGPLALGLAAVYAIAKNLDHSGTPHTGAGTSYSAASGYAQASAGASGAGLFSTGIAYDSSTEQMTTGLVQSIVQILDSTATAFGKEAGYQAAASFADDSSKDGAYAALNISKLGQVITDFAVWKGHGQVLSDGEAGSAEFLARAAADVRTALDAMDLPGWADDVLRSLGDSPSLQQLADAMDKINQVQSAIASQRAGLQQQYDLLAGVTTQREIERKALDESNRALYDQITALQDQKAATEAAVEAAKAVAQERAGLQQQYDLLAGITTQRELERAALDESNRALYDQIQALQDQQAASEAAAQAAAEQAQRIADQRASLQDQLDGLTLTAAQQLERQRNALDESNRALFDQVQAATAAAEAERALAEQTQRVTAERIGLQDQLDNLTLTAAQLLEKQRNALDESNRALFDQVQAATAAAKAAAEEQAAQEKAAAEAERAAQAAADALQRAADAAAAAAQKVAQEHDGLYRQYLSTIGDTAALRALELAELDPANRALQEQIWALQDQKEAADKATTAAEQMKSAWGSLTDSITTEVRRIRGLIDESSGASYNSLAAQFATATAQARAGDQKATGLLTGLSQSMLTAYEATATSLVDLQRVRALTANSLEQTASLLGGETSTAAPVAQTSTGRSRGGSYATASDATTYAAAPTTPAYGLSDMVIELRGEISALKDEVKGLRAEALASGGAIAANTGGSLRLHKQWNDVGLPITTETDLAAVYGD